MTDTAAAPAVSVPELSLVVLVGVSGSGKSTFARRHFGRYEVVSSDVCRGMVSDDENDQSATRAAFDLLHHVAGLRLDAGRLTVVDATNVQPDARRELVALARAHDVLPVAIVLDVPEQVAVERNAARPDRAFGAGVVRRQHDQLRRSLRGLAREGFRDVHVLRGVEAVGAATVVRRRLLTDLRHEAGPFDVVGDVHGCRAELEELLAALGYALVRDGQGRPVDASHPDGRRAVFLGDLVDRGPDTPGVLRLAMGMVRAGHALAVPGNHEHKLVRAARGDKVRVSPGLALSLAQLDAEEPAFREEALAFCRDLVSHLVLDGGRLVVAHAGLKEAYQGRSSARVREFALFGDTTGETDGYGLPVRYPWAEEYRGRATVLYGHTPVAETRWVNGTLCLDTGCVFGGRLTALRYPEKDLVSVPAGRVWFAPAKPLDPGAGAAVPGGPGETGPGAAGPGERAAGSRAPAAGAGPRAPDLLDVADVLGRRVVETAHHGRVGVREESAAAALEVMSRFAVDPRWLVYLPPTMSPCATSDRDDLLEHPGEAFRGYAADGVARVVCEEKHMGSRAVAVVCRDADAARARFGAAGGAEGVVVTRTGRPFLPPGPAAELVDRIAAALEAAGVWEELGATWVALDAELLPWSLKADGLLRSRYAPVRAAASCALPAALGALRAAADTGLDVGDLLARTSARARDVEAFGDAYRRYVWPTDGLDGVRFAPFQVLASDGATYETRDHLWHLGVADRLVAADPGLLAPTRSLVVDTGDPASVEAGVRWWEELTAAGGEGMVVKPLANLVQGRRGLVQPGVKVRGGEYLRLVYGPEYAEPGNLARLRARNLGHKRSLALRGYALGLEALARAAAGEPLWRVHEAVFAVLALESEPVDPRL